MCVSSVGRVIRLDEGRAEVLIAGRTRWMNTALRPDVRVGEYVIVQTGLILDRVSEAEAVEMEHFQREMETLLDVD